MTAPDDANEASVADGPPPEGPQPTSPQPEAELPARTARDRSEQIRWVAVDAILPGVGHLAAGRRRLGLTFGIPTAIAIGLLVGLLAAVPSTRLAAEAINAFAILLLVQALVLGWRLLAVISGLRATLPRPATPRAGIMAVALVAFVIVPQAYFGYVTNVAREEIDRVFDGRTGGAWVPSATPSPAPTIPPSASPGATLIPSPSPTPDILRINILLVGIDSGVGRRTAATDTMIVASLDPVTETVSMVSLPRDMVDVPLPDGSIYRPKINGLHSDARRNPSRFPGSDGTGNDVLMAAAGTLLGLQIDYYATVNLGGFVRVVDILGGVEVTVTRALCDPGYDEYGFSRGFSISPGLRHLNGSQALAYARVRKAAGESDFTRAARQQEVIAGLRDAVVKRGFLSDPVALLQALGRSLETNVPRELLPELAAVMVRVDRSKTYRAVIKSPFVRSGFDARGSIQIPDVTGIRALAATLFPPTGMLPDTALVTPPAATKGGGSGVSNCLPKATPTPAPTPSVEPTPSGEPTSTPDPSPSAGTSPTPSPLPTPALTPSPAPS